MADLVLTKIDQELLPDYSHLDESDECYFLREYTSKQGFNYGKTNDLISNLHKRPSKWKDTPTVWRHKTKAIVQVAQEFFKVLPTEWVGQMTFVPIPPSKIRSDPDFDDRMWKVLEKLDSLVQCNFDFRELVCAKESMKGSHACEPGDRATPIELYKNYLIDEDKTTPLPRIICVIDDVLTTGSHFKAMKRILSERFSGIQIIGVFIARRVFLDS